MKKIFLSFFTVTALFFNSPIFSQSKNASISFNTTNYNFGEMVETEGIKTYKFEFTNTGGSALIIQNVSTSCGCTTPEWTKEPVRPGQKGFVSAAYDPAGRPGPFEKYISVQSNAETPMVKLTITGRVSPKPLSIEDQYRYPFGSVRMNLNHLSFGTVLSKQTLVRNIDIINTSSAPQSIKLENIPAHLSAEVKPSTLAPNQKGIIAVTYNAAKKPDWGFIIDRISVFINGKTDNSYNLLISANIEEDFSSISAAEKANAPKISFEQNTFDFGTIKEGVSTSYEYKFTNSGKSNLLIRKVVASCGCTATITSADMIPAGGSGTIKTTFNSAGKVGRQNKTITVITNDPENPKIILWVKGDVTE